MAQENNNGQPSNLKQLLKVRRDKLAELQENGKDPYQITKYDVTHHSTEIKDNFDTMIETETFRFMLQETAWVKNHLMNTRHSREWISVIS